MLRRVSLQTRTAGVVGRLAPHFHLAGQHLQSGASHCFCRLQFLRNGRARLIPGQEHVLYRFKEHALSKPPRNSRRAYDEDGSQGHHSRMLKDVEQFEATYLIGTSARPALALLIDAEQSRSGIVLLGKPFT